VPSVVLLTEGDQALKLDLGHSAYLALLRARLNSAGHAVLTEAPTSGALGWFGGRAHEIIVPMTAVKPSGWPALPPITATRVIGRDHGQLPGVSTWLLTKLYSHAERHAEILARHLPQLWSEWDEPPAWWYLRYRDPESHLRLRIALSRTEEFGPTAHRVSRWAGHLRSQGLLRDVQFATSYPETGRWGTGSVMAAAEEVFGADSRALVTQFAEPTRPPPPALAAANFVAITTAFTGSIEAGMNWLITHAKTDVNSTLDRPVLAEAVRLADPTDHWAALRATPGGQAIIKAWQPRDRALSGYRACLEQAEGIDPDSVLDSLLHAHHIRSIGIDRNHERTCLRLARAAALTWNARYATNRQGR